MYFDVYINGERLGTYGHADVENMSVSVASSTEGSYVFAGGVCRDGGKSYHLHWLERDLAPNDEVRVVPVAGGDVAEPLRKVEMGRTTGKAWEEGVCEFCQRSGSQVGRLIPGDANRPGICSDCVEICNEILRKQA